MNPSGNHSIEPEFEEFVMHPNKPSRLEDPNCKVVYEPSFDQYKAFLKLQTNSQWKTSEWARSHSVNDVELYQAILDRLTSGRGLTAKNLSKQDKEESTERDDLKHELTDPNTKSADPISKHKDGGS